MAKTTGTLNLHIVDSTRQPFQGTALVTLRDGNGRQLHRNHHDACLARVRVAHRRIDANDPAAAGTARRNLD